MVLHASTVLTNLTLMQLSKERIATFSNTDCVVQGFFFFKD